MSPWQELLELAVRDLDLATEGRWDELAEGLADRTRLAERLPVAPLAAAPLLARLAELQAQLTATLIAARDETARELGSLRHGRGAMRSYAAASAAPGGWVDESS